MMVDRFQQMVRSRRAKDLPSWLSEVAVGPLAAESIAADRSAMIAALTEQLSNYQTDGKIKSE